MKKFLLRMVSVLSAVALLAVPAAAADTTTNTPETAETAASTATTVAPTVDPAQATQAVLAAAAAQGETYIADDLKAMGLFNGTDKGYELDRVPSRAEASAMLVRLLGKEKEATAGKYTTPFTDVPAWANPYVGYLYTNKLAGGVSATKFGSTSDCTAQMFATFLLRVAGYSDTAGDFTYDGALAAAADKGVVNSANVPAGTAKFDRGNMVAFIGDALGAKMKDADQLLIEKLSGDGALNADTGAGFVSLYKNYAELNAKSTAFQNAKSFTFDITEDMKMAQGDQNIAITMAIKMAQNNLEGGKSEGTADISLTMTGLSTEEAAQVPTSMKMYYKDGVYYIDAADQKVKMATGLESATSATGLVSLDRSMIKSITKTDTSYDIELNQDRFVSFVNSLVGGLLGAPVSSGKMTFDNLTYNLTLDDAGNLSAVKLSTKITMAIAGQTISMDLNLDGKIAVSDQPADITAPTDLDQYKG